MIPYQIQVRIDLINIIGQKVSTVINSIQDPGEYQYIFNGNDLDSGIYFYRIRVGQEQIIKKMIIIK